MLPPEQAAYLLPKTIIQEYEYKRSGLVGPLVLKTRRQQTPSHPPAGDVMLGPGVLAPAEAEGSRQPFHPGTIVKIRGDNNLCSLVSPYPRISTSSPTQLPLNAVRRQAPPEPSLLNLRRPWHMPPPPTLTEGPLTGHHRQLPMLPRALSSPEQRSKWAASGL
jgi:hypothetical protein